MKRSSVHNTIGSPVEQLSFEAHAIHLGSRSQLVLDRVRAAAEEHAPLFGYPEGASGLRARRVPGTYWATRGASVGSRRVSRTCARTFAEIVEATFTPSVVVRTDTISSCRLGRFWWKKKCSISKGRLSASVSCSRPV